MNAGARADAKTWPDTDLGADAGDGSGGDAGDSSGRRHYWCCWPDAVVVQAQRARHTAPGGGMLIGGASHIASDPMPGALAAVCGTPPPGAAAVYITDMPAEAMQGEVIKWPKLDQGQPFTGLHQVVGDRPTTGSGVLGSRYSVADLGPEPAGD